MTVQVVETKSELQGNAKFAEDVIAAAIAATPEIHPNAIRAIQPRWLGDKDGASAEELSKQYSSFSGIDTRILADDVVVGNVQAVAYELDHNGKAMVQFVCLWLGEGSGPNSWFARPVQDYVIRASTEYGVKDEIVLGPLRVASVKGGMGLDDMVSEYVVTLETYGKF